MLGDAAVKHVRGLLRDLAGEIGDEAPEIQDEALGSWGGDRDIRHRAAGLDPAGSTAELLHCAVPIGVAAPH